jgi:hypothetical protein
VSLLSFERVGGAKEEERERGKKSTSFFPLFSFTIFLDSPSARSRVVLFERERVDTSEKQPLATHPFSAEPPNEREKTKGERRTMVTRLCAPSPMRSLALLLVLAVASSFSPVALAKRGALRYEEGDSVVLYANKVGPFKNPR